MRTVEVTARNEQSRPPSGPRSSPAASVVEGVVAGLPGPRGLPPGHANVLTELLGRSLEKVVNCSGLVTAVEATIGLVYQFRFINNNGKN